MRNEFRCKLKDDEEFKTDVVGAFKVLSWLGAKEVRTDEILWEDTFAIIADECILVSGLRTNCQWLTASQGVPIGEKMPNQQLVTPHLAKAVK